MIESQNTKAPDDPVCYECHHGYKTCTRDDYENSCDYDWRASKKEEIMCKCRLEDPKFNGYPNPRVLVIG